MAIKLLILISSVLAFTGSDDSQTGDLHFLFLVYLFVYVVFTFYELLTMKIPIPVSQ